jgi:hypothetical protein
MEKRQITRQELVAAALKLGARPGTIRQWFHRGIPYRWQIARGDGSNRQILDCGNLAQEAPR